MNKIKLLGLAIGLMLVMNAHANAASAAACAGMASSTAVNYQQYVEEECKVPHHNPNPMKHTNTDVLVCLGIIVGWFGLCRVVDVWINI